MFYGALTAQTHEPGALAEVGPSWGNGGGEIKDILRKLKRSVMNREMGKYGGFESIEFEAKLKVEKHKAGADDE